LFPQVPRSAAYEINANKSACQKMKKLNRMASELHAALCPYTSWLM
jgi:hypothetical protein